LPSTISVTAAAVAVLTTEVAVTVASAAPSTEGGALKVTVVAVWSLSVAPRATASPDRLQVTPALLTSAVTLAVTTIVVACWIWVTLPGVDRATPVPMPTLPVTPRLLALLQATSVMAATSGNNITLATAPGRHGFPGQITVNSFSSNPGNPVPAAGAHAGTPPARYPGRLA
jgi:hypothetical protein